MWSRKTVAAVLLAMVFAADSAPAQCPSYTTAQLQWDDISNGQKFAVIFGNPDSNTIWGALKDRHPSGGLLIAKHDPSSKTWLKDSTQPVGAIWMAVSSKGLPALIQTMSPSKIFAKKVSGSWDEFRGCSRYTAFGEKDVLYRLGCGWYVSERKNNEWNQVGDRKARFMSASKDALWIVDYETRIPHKFD